MRSAAGGGAGSNRSRSDAFGTSATFASGTPAASTPARMPGESAITRALRR